MTVYIPKVNCNILQVSDLHLKDYPWNEEDQKTLYHLKKTIRLQQPDMVVFSGDMVWSSICKDPLNSFTALFNFCQSLDTPVVFTYGNHDSNHSQLSRRKLRELEQSFDFKIAKQNKMIDLDRECFAIELVCQNDRRWLMCVIDSGGYCQSCESRYEWVTTQQIQWLNKTIKSYQKHTPSIQVIVVQHIPLTEYFEAYQLNKEQLIHSHPEEYFRVDSPDVDSGMFDFLMNEPAIKGMFVGHNHNNFFDMVYKNVRLIFGRVSGYSANANIERGVRLINLGAQLNSTILRYDWQSNKKSPL